MKFCKKIAFLVLVFLCKSEMLTVGYIYMSMVACNWSGFEKTVIKNYIEM